VGRRRQARERALQALYQMDVSGGGADDAIGGLRDNGLDEGADAGVLHYAEVLVRGVAENLTALDEVIQRHSPNWRIERMARIDRNVLRIATFELIHRPDVPPKVVLNEAIEVAKRFGTEESGAFINGILDKVAKEARAPAQGSG
jgi:transcription antitermination protein NusB